MTPNADTGRVNPVNRRGFPPEHYAAVAEVYLEEIADARAAGRQAAPGPAIAATWGIPVTTAHAWARRARERGLLDGKRNSMAGHVPKCRNCSLHCPPPIDRSGT